MIVTDPRFKHVFKFNHEAEAAEREGRRAEEMLVRSFTPDEHKTYAKLVIELREAYPDDGGVQDLGKLSSVIHQMLELGWSGIRYVYKDADKKEPLEFEADDDGKPTQQMIARLEFNERIELALFIAKVGVELSEADAKNFKSPSLSTSETSNETATSAELVSDTETVGVATANSPNQVSA